jgi:predicted ATP-grasp superfamily ATP-dependent carboligase
MTPSGRYSVRCYDGHGIDLSRGMDRERGGSGNSLPIRNRLRAASGEFGVIVHPPNLGWRLNAGWDVILRRSVKRPKGSSSDVAKERTLFWRIKVEWKILQSLSWTAPLWHSKVTRSVSEGTRCGIFLAYALGYHFRGFRNNALRCSTKSTARTLGAACGSFRQPMHNQITIVGASVRAAAESAAAAGQRVHAFDLFADGDLAQVAQATCVANDGYPHCLVDHLASAPPAPWMYTGGIENHPTVIEHIGRRHELLGNPAAVVNLTCDPDWLADVATSAGWRVPRTPLAPEPGMIRKPAKHCGGMRTHRIRSKDDLKRPGDLEQEFVPGPVFGGVFIGDPERRTSHFLGATRQQTVSDVAHHPLIESHPFAYVGSVGPVEMEEADRAAWQALGLAISAATPLRGMFGVDAVNHTTRGWTMLELNPRWTASVELLEIAHAFNAFHYHQAACRGMAITSELPEPDAPARFAAKRVLYARDRVEFDGQMKQQIVSMRHEWQQVTVHDFPREGTTIEAMRPALTLIATAPGVSTAQAHIDEALRSMSQVGLA